MAQQNIDFGTFPNDPNADAIRAAFQKVQENFTELFSGIYSQGVTSVNRTPGAGITVNSPYGNVVVNANISNVQVYTNTLSIGLNTNGSQYTTLTNSAQILFIDLPANISNVTNISLANSVVANYITANLNITSSNTIIANGNITGGNLTTAGILNVTGNANVGNISATGVVATTLSGSLTTAAQPNITSVGTLTGLSVNGNITAANITANTGVFTGNGSGLSAIVGANVIGAVSSATTATSATTAGTVTTAAQPNITSVGTLTSLSVTNKVTAGQLQGDGGNISNIQGGNVSGAVSFATTANAVAGANVSGQVSNALVAGEVYTSTQPNITSVGTLTGLSVNGNITAANITANTGVFTGNGSGLSAIVGANVTGTVASATSATTAGTVTTAAQPNITSVGTLSALSVTGNITSGNANLGNLASANFFQGDGSLLTNVGISQNVLYVSKSGNDTNSGTSLSNAKLTIAAAVTLANTLQASNPSGMTVIFVKAGNYTESNPISLSAGVSIVGDGLRSVSVRPANPTQDIFWVRNRCYITGMTFRDHLSPAAAVAFPSSGAGFIVTSPYIQNCSSITTTGAGMRIDGNLADGLKSMVLDSYTQFNQGGLGIHIINQGYAQLVSIFTICCTAGVKCESGGTCSIANSNNSFGDYGLWAEGVGPTLYTGTLTAITRETMTFSGLSVRPAVNDAVLVTDGVNSQYILVRQVKLR